MYVIRIIAMVDSKDIQQHRKPINVMVEIDDRPGGDRRKPLSTPNRLLG